MKGRRAFTLVELVFLLLVALAIGAAVAIYLAAERRESRDRKEQQQLRAIHQGFLLGAQVGPTATSFRHGLT
jgi:type II secretory pathway pseudopilin PulG